MGRRLSVVASLALIGLLAAACGSDPDVQAGDASPVGADRGTSIASTTTTAPADTTTAPVETTTTVAPTTEVPTTVATTPPATDAPLDCVRPADLPPLVRAEADGYDTVGAHEGLGAADNRRLALFTAGGAVATQDGDGDASSIEYRIGPDGGIGPHGTIEHALLYDLVITPEGPAVLYGEIYQGDGEPLADVKLLDIGTGATTKITESQAPEYSVYRAAAADGIVVTSAYADLSENISTWALDGSGQLDRYTPVLAENYGLPPFYGPAVPSPDASKLAWLEGPDVVEDAADPEGDWQLVVADAVSGAVDPRMVLAAADDDFTWFDWDGQWAVLSRGQGAPVMAVDTVNPENSPATICSESGDGLLTGVVTFVVR